MFDLRACLLDTAFDEFGLHFGFLSSEQINFRFKRSITRQSNLDSVLSRTNQHGMEAAEFARVPDVLVIKKHCCASRLDVQFQLGGNVRWHNARAEVHGYLDRLYLPR